MQNALKVFTIFNLMVNFSGKTYEIVCPYNITELQPSKIIISIKLILKLYFACW